MADRDGDTALHCARVAHVADRIAGQLGGLSASRREDLWTACLLHDVGKLRVPLAILRKAGSLDEYERRKLRAHAIDGFDLVRSVVGGACRAPQIVRQHHERIDGRGYPEGIGGDRILLEARIVAVADAFDAMVFDRPYRRGVPFATAIGELRRSAADGPGDEGQFDRWVVEALAGQLPEVARLYDLPQRGLGDLVPEQGG